MKPSLAWPRWGILLAGTIALDVLVAAGWVATCSAFHPVDTAGEAIAVLWGDDSELGPEGERRLNQAMALWLPEHSALVFCVGGSRPGQGFLGARLMCDRLTDRGIPADRLRVGPGSNDTISNLAEVAALARGENVRVVTVVSDPLQAWRARHFLVTSSDRPSLVWVPYDYHAAAPPISVFRLWQRVHHEWLAIASLALPETVRRGLVLWLRA